MSEEQKNNQDSTYHDLDLSKMNDDCNNYQSLITNEVDTIYREPDTTQMNADLIIIN